MSSGNLRPYSLLLVSSEMENVSSCFLICLHNYHYSFFKIHLMLSPCHERSGPLGPVCTNYKPTGELSIWLSVSPHFCHGDFNTYINKTAYVCTPSSCLYLVLEILFSATSDDKQTHGWILDLIVIINRISFKVLIMSSLFSAYISTFHASSAEPSAARIFHSTNWVVSTGEKQ